MLAKRHRLTTAAFNDAFKAGKRVHTPLFQVIYVPSTEFHSAVVVGKKVFPRAVDRNRLRRQLYGVLYQAHRATAGTGIFLVLVKPAARGASRAKRRDALIASINQLTCPVASTA